MADLVQKGLEAVAAQLEVAAPEGLADIQQLRRLREEGAGGDVLEDDLGPGGDLAEGDRDDGAPLLQCQPGRRELGRVVLEPRRSTATSRSGELVVAPLGPLPIAGLQIVDIALERGVGRRQGIPPDRKSLLDESSGRVVAKTNCPDKLTKA